MTPRDCFHRPTPLEATLRRAVARRLTCGGLAIRACETAIAAQPRRTRLHLALGLLLAELRRDGEAITRLDAAWEAAKRAGRRELAAICCNELASAYRRTGSPSLAVRMQQLALKNEMDSGGCVSCSTLLNLADDAADRGESARERDYLHRARAVADATRAADVLIRLGTRAAADGDFAAAIGLLRQGVRAARRAGNVRQSAENWSRLGRVLCQAGREREALAAFRRGARRYLQMGDLLRSGECSAFAERVEEHRLVVLLTAECN